MKRIAILCRQSTEQQMSLDEQERLGRAYAEGHQMKIIALWRVVGGTSEEDITQFFEGMRRQGVRAYDDLKRLWDSRAFDVLWALDATRIGRAKWLYAHMIERTISSGAEVHLHNGGIINMQNFDVMVGVTSIGSKADIQRLHGERAQATRRNKADQGIPPTGMILWTHERVFDPSGKVIGVQLKEGSRAVLARMGRLVLAGYSYRDISRMLTVEGYPHMREHGHVLRVLFHPLVHGHIGYRFAGKPDGVWKLESGHRLPAGVHMAYDVLPVAWSPSVHTDVIQELKSRLKENGGRGSRAEAVNPFYKLVKCGVCGAYMNYAKVRSRGYVYEYLRCHGRCEDNRAFTRLDLLRDWMGRALRQAIREGILLVGDQTDRVAVWQAQMTQLETAMERQERMVSQLILNEAERPDLAHLYLPQINSQRQILKSLQTELVTLRAARPVDPVYGQRALSDIEAMTVDNLWQMSNADINRILRDAMGETRLYLIGDQVWFG